ncbi:Fic family protein [Microbacterium sp. A93]|uniref:Fic family protein n=1 Tax=Microbacterium sp. A93 TaxID=3450716 RepID=UPI003F4434D7
MPSCSDRSSPGKPPSAEYARKPRPPRFPNLHRRLCGDGWTWAGRYRTHIVNIGIDPVHVASELRGSLETSECRWNHTSDWTARELGIAVHADGVRIHPFVDGNGRATRLLADRVIAAAQDCEAVELYDWQIDKARYVQLLRAYDVHRDPTDLAVFISTYELR